MVRRTRKLVTESLESRQLMAAVSLDAHWDHQEKRLKTPLHIEDAEGVRAAEIRLQYDPSVLSTDELQIRSGSVWNGNASVVVNVNEEEGSIIAFVFSAEPIEQADGDLLEVDFALASARAKRKPISIDLQKVELNEGRIEIETPPVVGTDEYDLEVPSIKDLDSERRHDHLLPPFLQRWHRRFDPTHIDELMREGIGQQKSGCFVGPLRPALSI
ncbi:cohesin domain-containing protein [Rhodopirellula sp. MGV]|uniref:cohesin domain-containing protein n=1 Tax=Rhodopirellula sp. MGV TaxID=2023130 RepID=UPI000B97A224|nr:cohesin domain-containing protein [Rhodopirellula sp. MGV]OYP39076.1 hypothetical protein CGZ80_00025 [Rhodopirellula sp. MGV]PNY35547.1 hypothetical protein C2E31_18825 [Rhodopirellula baltica]